MSCTSFDKRHASKVVKTKTNDTESFRKSGVFLVVVVVVGTSEAELMSHALFLPIHLCWACKQRAHGGGLEVNGVDEWADIVFMWWGSRGQQWWSWWSVVVWSVPLFIMG
mmetsp:Transcript_25699/g.55299  ORF Transcript_25699/g.55299 Transcript_25699/m.55299 type:complete len:110 (+) Transcript_25699:1094-1423(+)